MPNSGKTTELSVLKLTLTSVNDAAGAQLENVEVYLKNNNTTYDLASSTGDGVYKNTNMGLVLTSGVVYEFVVRTDIKSTATNGDYTVKLADAAGGDLVLKETGNDTLVTDITPNSVTLNKVSVIAAGVEFSRNVLSAAYNAVVGTADVEILNFNIKAGQTTDVKVTQLSFLDHNATATKSVVSEFKLSKQNTDGTYTLLKTVSANDLAANAIALNDLAIVVTKDTTAKFKLTTSLVNDVNQNGKVMRWGVSGYATEDTDKGTAIYDTVNDNVLANGVIAGGEVGYTGLLSARSVTVVGTGSLNVSVDNTPSAYADSLQLAGTKGVVLAYFKLKSTNEKVKVTKLLVHASSDMSSLVAKYSLVDSAGNIVAYTDSITSQTSTLDQDFVVDGEQTYILKADLNKIGLDQPGLEDMSSTFSLLGVEAEGYSSGSVLADDGTENSALAAGEIGYESDAVHGHTNISLQTAVVASKIASVSLLSTAGTTSLDPNISSGTPAKVAIIAVTAAGSNTNTNLDGTAIKTLINQVKVKIEGVTSWTNATIERIGVAGAVVTTSATAANYALFDTNGTTDFQVNPGETAYFLVRLTPAFSAGYAGAVTLKVGLDNLNGTNLTPGANATTGNFTWKDSNTAVNKIQTRILGVNYVDGIGIKN